MGELYDRVMAERQTAPVEPKTGGDLYRRALETRGTEPVAESTIPAKPSVLDHVKKSLLGRISSTVLGGVKEKLEGTKSLAVGAAKGVGSTVAGAEKLGGKIIDAPLKAIGVKPPVEDGLFEREKEKGSFTPDGTAEKIGYGAEQVGEFFLPIPGGAKAKVAEKAVEGATKLAKAGSTALKIGKEAADVAGRSAIQSGSLEDVPENVALSAGLGAVGKIATKAAKESASRIINSLIKPLSKDLAYGKNPAKGVLDEGIVATSLEDLAEKVGVKRIEVGSEIGAMVKDSKKKIDVLDALKPLNDAIVQAQKTPRTNSAIIQRLEDARADLMEGMGAGANLLASTKKLKSLSAAEAFDLKRLVADVTRFTGAPSDDKTVNMALKKTYGLLKEKLNKAVPGLEKLNERYANLSSAEIAARYRDKIEARQNLVSLRGSLGMGGTAIVTALLTGGATIPVILGGMAGSQLDKVLGSAAVKTAVAKFLRTMSNKELDRIFTKIPALRSVLPENQNESEQENQDSLSPTD